MDMVVPNKISEDDIRNTPQPIVNNLFLFGNKILGFHAERYLKVSKDPTVKAKIELALKKVSESLEAYDHIEKEILPVIKGVYIQNLSLSTSEERLREMRKAYVDLREYGDLIAEMKSHQTYEEHLNSLYMAMNEAEGRPTTQAAISRVITIVENNKDLFTSKYSVLSKVESFVYAIDTSAFIGYIDNMLEVHRKNIPISVWRRL